MANSGCRSSEPAAQPPSHQLSLEPDAADQRHDPPGRRPAACHCGRRPHDGRRSGDHRMLRPDRSGPRTSSPRCRIELVTAAARRSTPARGPRFPLPDDIFQLRVSLIDVEPLIWRRLLVAKDVTLPRLHPILQAAMGWTNSHLHQFRLGDVSFAEPHPDYEPGPIDYRNIRLNQIAPRRGSTCIYEYDFGDGWEHLLEVEDELPIDTVRDPVPRCLGGARACPPEDCGGPFGYAEFLEAIRNPKHPEHDHMLEWADPEFDPERFDPDRVNRGLARYATRPTLPPGRRDARRRSSS